MSARLVATLAAAVVLGIIAPASASSTPTPRIYGGTPATGDPSVLRLALFDGTEWPHACSGVLLRPRLILTSAHCMTIPGSAAGVAGFAVFPPGATALTYRDIGPQGAANVHVVNAWKPSDYVNVNATVQPNDIAILQLDADLGPTAGARLATNAEAFEAWRNNAAVTHVGYGLIGPGQDSNEPFRTTLPMSTLADVTGRGRVFGTAQSSETGICPGDSGSPAYLARANDAVLLGAMAGGNAPCSGASTYSNVGFLAMGYLDMVNTALAAAGHPTIPSAPRDVRQQARNRDVIVSWAAPQTSPETVVGYDVLDARGNVVCQSTTTQCTVADLSDGRYAFTVRSRNAENEGDARPTTAPAAVVAAPSALPAPTVRTAGTHRVRITTTTLAGRSSAVVTSYLVRDGRGKTVCRIVPKTPEARTLSCLATVRPGTHRFTVQPVTQLGTPPASKPSRPIRVS